MCLFAESVRYVARSKELLAHTIMTEVYELNDVDVVAAAACDSGAIL